MKQFTNIFQKGIIITLLVTIVTASAYIIDPPKKAEANVATCVGVFTGAYSQANAEKQAAVLKSVPIINMSPIADSVVTAAAQHTFWNDCIMETLVLPFIKMALAKMTDSLVAWINGGFNGSPSFVTDPEKFFTDTADQLAGQFILGTDLAFLCKPFNANIRLALAINYSNNSSFGAQSQCTLSGIFKNVETAFDNNFQNGGWKGWFAISQNPGNNPYGAYMQASEALALKIGNNQSIELSKLNWGGGFLSWGECYSRGTDGKPTGGSYVQYGQTPNTASGRQQNVNYKNSSGDNCEIKTPGKVIAAPLEAQLGVAATQLGLADDIDKLVNALGNQIFERTIAGAHGLLGTGSYGGSQSSGRFDNFDKDYWKKYTDLAQQSTDQSAQDLQNSLGTPPEQDDQDVNPTENIALKGLPDAYERRSEGVDYTNLNNGDRSDKPQITGLGNDNDDRVKTGRVDGPWLQIKLQKEFRIGRVIVAERNERPSAGTNIQYRIDIFSKDDQVTPVWSSTKIETQEFTSVPKEFIIPNIKGQYVRIQGIGTGALYINELEVYPYAKPLITLKRTANGATTPITVPFGTSYVDPGASAIDTNNNDISAAIVTTGADVNSSVAGNYDVIYTVTDNTNPADPLVSTKTRKVVVQAGQ